MTIHLILRIATVLVLSMLPVRMMAAPAPVAVLFINGAIGPAAADYIKRGLANAQKIDAQLAVLEMDTPGGLDSSMRSVIKAILASPIPVAVYVGPGGARAASAGTYILYASHIAAMAPGTNLGAATPVQIGAPGSPNEPRQAPQPKQDKNSDSDTRAQKGKDDAAERATTNPMTQKQVNDAAAYIRGLAQLRGRNAEWAEQAVRQAVSLPADEALKLGVVDLVARDRKDLLRQLEGRKFVLQGREIVLRTAAPDVQVTEFVPDWRARLLAVITDPTIALLLMTIGIYGLVLEFLNPGATVPGVLGGICLLVALYALQLLPVNYAGVALIVLGIAFMIAEAFLPSFGVLGIGGVAAFVTGAVILVDTELPGFGIPLSLIIALAIASAFLMTAVVGMALKSRRLKRVSGGETMIGDIAEVLDDGAAEGWVKYQGETWRAASKTPLRRGEKVRILARNGLVLEVAPDDNIRTGE